jgi:hypothetical protein
VSFLTKEGFSKDDLVIRKYELRGLSREVQLAIKKAALGSAIKEIEENGGGFCHSIDLPYEEFRIIGKGLVKSSEGDQM